jgi:putative PIN family toxin of toxin-antitoxin system
MNIVLDTNTVISGLLWKGAPRQILDLARSGTITLFTSPALLAELSDVLAREKFSVRLEQASVSVEELILGYASLAITVRPDKIESIIKVDPADDHVLACAKTANAEIIISGDNHLLDLGEYAGIEILTVNQLLEKYI